MNYLQRELQRELSETYVRIRSLQNSNEEHKHVNIGILSDHYLRVAKQLNKSMEDQNED